MNMLNNKDSQIEKTAHEWLMTITSDQANDADIEAFIIWRDGNPQHAEAYAGISHIWNELGVLARSPQGENLRKSVDDRAGNDNILTKFIQAVKQNLRAPQYALASVAALIALVFFMQPPAIQAPDIYQTTRAEIQEIVLADGSIITLGALSRVEVLYSEDRRNVSLKKGQAFFDVAKNPKKPFYVKAQDTEIRVLGTKFDVHLGPQDLTVGVLEGRVQVTPKQLKKKPSQTKVLTAGQIVSTTKAGFTDNITIAQVKPGAWRGGRLVYKKEVFSKIIADANRYYSGHIKLEDDSLAHIHVTTSFDVHQIDDFLKTLPEIFNVEVLYLSSGDVIITPLKRTKNTQNIAFNNP
ncbi:MAG: hypothetical protein COB54_00155 [Alphaproteobacteria bacterium]|nr:MAG: hypothetical protein COB54_00155 [Alphaproteobacteria bacterium]